jgi:hypothetical protein
MHFGDETVKRLDCGHLLHHKCIAQVIHCAASESSVKCPLCRAPIMKRQTIKCRETIRRNWLETQLIETDWIPSIESAYLEEQFGEHNTQELDRGYGLQNSNGGTSRLGDGVVFDRDSTIHSVRDMGEVSPTAHAIWQGYQEQITNDTVAATLRAQAAWKEYEDNMTNEINEYESRAMAAWLEEENRIEIGRIAME